jgi:hypothetical protein
MDILRTKGMRSTFHQKIQLFSVKCTSKRGGPPSVFPSHLLLRAERLRFYGADHATVI